MVQCLHGGLCNVDVGTAVTIREVAEKIRYIVGYQGEIYDTAKPDVMPRRLLDSSRISALGWKPRITLTEGLEKMYRWYLKIQEGNK